MSERTLSMIPNRSNLRSQSCCDSRNRVARATSELHRQTVDRAQRRFEEQLANSERELRSALKQRRDYSSSPAQKQQATQHLENLRTTLNNDYAQLIQDKVDEVEKYMNHRHDEERQLDRAIAQRKLQEAVQETQLQSEKTRLESINQIIRERDTICEEKLATQKNLYTRLLDEQARRLRAEQTTQSNKSSTDQLEIAQLKGRLARIEYEHRELKKLVLDLHTDLSALITQQPTFRSTVTIPHFIVKP